MWERGSNPKNLPWKGSGVLIFPGTMTYEVSASTKVEIRHRWYTNSNMFLIIFLVKLNVFIYDSSFWTRKLNMG